MSNNAAKSFLILAAAALFLIGMLLFRPGYFSDSSGLTLLLGGEVLLAAVATYRKTYLTVLLICFLVAGTGLPFKSELLQARWMVLAVGAVVGFAVYLKTHLHRLQAFHLVALFCVLSGLVSASVSAYPNEALLKALSLFLLFLYAATGARTAVPAQPERFFSLLVVAIEILTWVSAIYYLVLRDPVFGNPNSLGAVMAVGCVPVLLCGFLAAQARTSKARLGIELMIALVLLFSSFARAAIVGSAISSILVCVSLREYRVLIKGTGIVVLLAICAVMFVPRQSDAATWDSSESISSIFLYKGKRETGVFGSRRSPWEQTWNVIQKNPWFGSGFGTSQVSEDMTKLDYAARHVDSWVIREHGNSYLAIIEWTGLLGVLPFYTLVLLTIRNVSLVFSWASRTRDAFSPALPAAAIVVAGLVDAVFEDWLFAVGYYLCVFVWIMAFILVDVMPSHGAVVYVPETTLPLPANAFAVAVPTK